MNFVARLNIKKMCFDEQTRVKKEYKVYLCVSLQFVRKQNEYKICVAIPKKVCVILKIIDNNNGNKRVFTIIIVANEMTEKKHQIHWISEVKFQNWIRIKCVCARNVDWSNVPYSISKCNYFFNALNFLFSYACPFSLSLDLLFIH